MGEHSKIDYSPLLSKDLIAYVITLNEKLFEIQSCVQRLKGELNECRKLVDDTTKVMRDGTQVRPSVLARLIVIEDALKDLTNELQDYKTVIKINKQLKWTLIIAIISNIVGATTTAIWQLIKLKPFW